MLGDCIGYLRQPGPVFHELDDFERGEILDGIPRRAPERFQGSGGNQNRDVVRLAILHPSRLLRVQAARELSQQHQEPMSIVIHTLEYQAAGPRGYVVL